MTTAIPAPPLVKFVPARGSPYSQADMDVIGPELYELARTGGGLRVDQIVAAATPPHSKLHPYLPWDDKEAAESYRKVVARKMAASVMICYKAKEHGRMVEKTVRALHFVVQQVYPDGDVQAAPAESSTVDGDDTEVIRPRLLNKQQRRIMITLDEVVDDANYIEQVITRALADFQSARARYDYYYTNFPQFRTKFKKIWQALGLL